MKEINFETKELCNSVPVSLGPLQRTFYDINEDQSDLVLARTDTGSVGSGLSMWV